MDIKFFSILILVAAVHCQLPAPGCTGQGPLVLGEYRYNGEFWTPNFPASYFNGAFCEWSITTPDPDLTSGIHLELYDFLLGVNDVVRIYDGNSDTAALLREFRGNATLVPVFSNGPAMYVTFESNITTPTNNLGFRATFNADPACTSGGRRVAFGEVTHAPMYPNSYAPAEFCVWNFVGPENTNIIFEISFIEFKLEGTQQSCTTNTADLFDIYVDGARVLRYCGYKYPSSFNLTGNAVRVVFESNVATSYRGFRFHVKDYQL